MIRSRCFDAALSAALVALAAALPGSAAAKPGQVDISYGQYGSANVSAVLPGPQIQTHAIGMAVGPENEAFVLSARHGCFGTGCVHDYFVNEFRADGSHEAAFGARAEPVARIEPAPGGPEFAPASGALTVQPDGKVLVAVGDLGRVVTVRLNADGSLDGSFGTGGLAQASLSGVTIVTSVAAARDGKVVVGGALFPGGTSAAGGLLLARFTTTGQPDPGFGTGGTTVRHLVKGAGIPAPVALRQGGVVAGLPSCCVNGGEGPAIGLFSDSGALTSSFFARVAPRGTVSVNRGVAAVIARGNGSIMVVGSTDEGTYVSSHLLGGEPDRRFGKGGVAFVPGVFVGHSQAVRDRFGGIIFAGSRGVTVDQSETMAIRRVLPSGRPDGNFGGAKPLLIVPGSREAEEFEAPLAIGAQTNGSVVVLARTTTDCIRTCPKPGYWGLVRYLGPRKKPARCKGLRATIVGSRQGDRLRGTAGRDVIAAFDGNDVVHGLGGNDLICGGPGDDLLIGGAGNDGLRGGSGRDRIRP